MADARGAQASPATDAAAALLDELIAHGLQHVVVCPGSRSQALALAAADADRRGRIAVHVRIDERSAGFFALGLAKASGRATAIVVTSGTAVGNLLPAVMEAHHAAVPLLLLTADRPPELRGIGANQATTQPGIFAHFVRFAVDAPVPDSLDAEPHRAIARDAWSAAMNTPAGPVHVNLPFREPLAGALPEWWGTADATGFVEGADSAPSDVIDWMAARRTIVVAGADAGPRAAEVAEAGGWPLIAEIVSGARSGTMVVPSYRAALRDAEIVSRIERVVVFGHPTLTREVAALLKRRDIEVIAVCGPGEKLNLNGSTRSVSASDVTPLPGDSDWAAEWLAERPAPQPLSAGISRADLVTAAWDATGTADSIMWASSRLVRVADDVLLPKAASVFSSRGLAGIDGTIATTCGIAAACDGITRLVIGDLAFLHDAGSLLQPADEPTPRVHIIVGNDGGGTIFDGLEVSQVASPDDFARVQYTPQQVDIESLAKAYGWAFERATTAAHLREVLASDRPHLIVEVPLAR